MRGALRRQGNHCLVPRAPVRYRQTVLPFAPSGISVPVVLGKEHHSADRDVTQHLQVRTGRALRTSIGNQGSSREGSRGPMDLTGGKHCTFIPINL